MKEDLKKSEEDLKAEFRALLVEGSDSYAKEASKNAMASYQKALELLNQEDSDVSVLEILSCF